MNLNTEFADKYSMLPSGCRVLCAVSGGTDSMCLLHFLIRHSKERGYSVACAHFNHRLRGTEADRDEVFAENYCRENEIEFYSGHGDTRAYASGKGLGIEEAARELRYAFLESAADGTGADKIATAHNADDNAETVLLNITRGTGLRGLCGIPPVRGRIIRPLLWATRAQLEEYAEANGIPHVEDGTNTEAVCSRNKIRGSVIPCLREINPRFAENVLRSSELLREDEEFISLPAGVFINENLKENSLPAKELANLPRPVSARVLSRVAGMELSAERIEALRRLCVSDDPSARLNIKGGRVRREYSRLIFGDAETALIEESTLVPGETLTLEEAGFDIICECIDNCPDIHNSLNIFFFQCESVYGKISVRCRRDGDRIRIIGRNCTKSLKKLFSDAKIPLARRTGVPVIADEAGVMAVYGFGQDEKYAAKAGDSAIKVEIRTRKGNGQT